MKAISYYDQYLLVNGKLEPTGVSAEFNVDFIQDFCDEIEALVRKNRTKYMNDDFIKEYIKFLQSTAIDLLQTKYKNSVDNLNAYSSYYKEKETHPFNKNIGHMLARIRLMIKVSCLRANLFYELENIMLKDFYEPLYWRTDKVFLNVLHYNNQLKALEKELNE